MIGMSMDLDTAWGWLVHKSLLSGMIPHCSKGKQVVVLLAVCLEGWSPALKHLPPFRKCMPEITTLPPRQQKDRLTNQQRAYAGGLGVTVDRQISSIVLF